MARILLVERDDLVRGSLALALSEDGHEVVHATSTAAARCALDASAFALVLLDPTLPDADERELLREVVRTWPDTAVVVLVEDTAVATAVRAVREGAYDYLSMPVDLARIARLAAHAIETYALRREVRDLRLVASGFVLPPEGVDLGALERSLVEQALARADGNRTRAGRLLGLNRDQVRYRAAKLAASVVQGDSKRQRAHSR